MIIAVTYSNIKYDPSPEFAQIYIRLCTMPHNKLCNIEWDTPDSAEAPSVFPRRVIADAKCIRFPDLSRSNLLVKKV